MSTLTATTIENLIAHCEEKALNLDPVSPDEAVELLNLPGESLMTLIASADRVRRRYKGQKVSLCSIINARSGRCPEDCAFCSQSVKHKTEIDEYKLYDSEKIVEAAGEALKNGSHKFGIVTSGKGAETADGELSKICESIEKMKNEVDIHRCASLGCINREEALALKEAGLIEYHHNLETARSFYPNVCTTRPYDENVAAVEAAKSVGLRVCSGGIFGMGEAVEQRIELAEELRALDVDSIPLNFLNPIPGTPMENQKPLSPIEILKIIAVYRLFFPEKDIKVAGGREKNLRDLQSLIFFAGANSTMIGNYLTTKGRKVEDDLQMIADLELEVVE